MISIKCLGHIGTSVGARTVELSDNEIDAEEIIARLRTMSRETDPGFTRYNTLVMVEDGEAFVPAFAGKIVRAGQKVVLIPFSHGG